MTSRRLHALGWMAAALLATGCEAAAERRTLRHASGLWQLTVGDRGECVADIGLPKENGVLTVLATDGGVSFAVRPERAPARGKTGTVVTDTVRFGFTPGYSEAVGAFFMEEDLDAGQLAALRATQTLRIEVDGRAYVDMPVAATLPAVLESVIACDRGERGWWGAGAKGG